MFSKHYESRKVKTTYILERREYLSQAPYIETQLIPARLYRSADPHRQEQTMSNLVPQPNTSATDCSSNLNLP